MNKKLVVVLGKLGRKQSFRSKIWGATGGDNEPPRLWRALFHNHPDVDFYFLGQTDYSSLDPAMKDDLNRYGNVHDPWEKFPAFRKSFPSCAQHEEKIRQFGKLYAYIAFTEVLDEIIPKNSDTTHVVGALITGPEATSSVLGHSRLMKNHTEYAKPLEMSTRYAGPIIHFLNLRTNSDPAFQWFSLSFDPRYLLRKCKDLFNPAKLCLTQFHDTQFKTSSLVDNYDSHKFESVKLPLIYAGLERTFLIGMNSEWDSKVFSQEYHIDKKHQEESAFGDFFGSSEEDDDNNQESNTIRELDKLYFHTQKDIQFMIIMNEGGSSVPSRYPLLKEFVLDRVKNVDIYGKWEHEDAIKDIRFKGPKKFSELAAILPNVKYTFCIPIDKGWATAKFWEMAYYGIIPFCHPSYDVQRNIQIPEFLYVKNAKELHEKVTMLDNDSAQYNKLKNELYNKLNNPNLYNGKILTNIIIDVANGLTQK